MKYLPILTLLLFSQYTFSQSVATDLLKKARDNFEKAEYELAQNNSQQAYNLFIKNNNWQEASQSDQVAIKSLIRLGKIEEALSACDQHFQFFSSKFSANHLQIAEVYHLQGEALTQKGYTDQAIEKLQKALAIYPLSETTYTQAQAACYNSLGLVYWSVGSNNLALEYMQKSADLRQKNLGEQHPDMAASYNDLGLVYSSQGESEKALQYYKKALATYLNTYGNDHPKIAIAYTNMGVVLFQKAAYEEAYQNYANALRIWEKIHNEQHPTIAFLYNNIGRVLEAQEKKIPALEKFKDALKIYKQNFGEKHPEVAYTYNLLGSLYAQNGEYDVAIDYFQEAIKANTRTFESANTYQNPNITGQYNYYKASLLLSSLMLKAQAFEGNHYNHSLKVKDLKASLETLSVCDTLIDQIRKVSISQQDKIALGNTASEVYEDAIRLCLDLEQVTLQKKFYRAKAFYFAERSKSAVLLEAISETNAKSFAQIPDQLIQEEKTLKNEMAYLEQKLAEKVSESEESAYREKLFALKRSYNQFIADLEQKFPQYYNLKYNVATADLSTLQNTIGSEDLVISYFTASKNKRLYVFYISKKKFLVRNVSLTEDWEGSLTALRNSFMFKNKRLFTIIAYDLYKVLFPANIPSGIKHLVIIPDGKLGSVPFEALLTKSTSKEMPYKEMPYLVNDFSVSYTYSASLFAQKFTQKESKEVAYQPNKILLVAPIHFERERIGDLPNTAREVEDIQQLFAKQSNENNADLVVEANANENSLKASRLSQYQFIHFATHGLVDEAQPALSCIFLRADSQNDGNLFSGEIYNLNVSASLVVLSACETGLGKISKGEGIIGLTRAWLYAGASNLAVSLWKVSDNSTATLMIDFYKNMFDKQAYPKALQQAKKSMINSDYAAPYYWAAFILVGNGN